MAAIRYDRGADGKLAAWVFPAGDRIFLRQCSDRFVADFGAEPCERFDGGDRVFWDFLVGKRRVTLHLDQVAGIAVIANEATPESETLVERIAEHLLAYIPPP